MTDKKIAAELGVDARDVRKARKKLGLSKSQGGSRNEQQGSIQPPEADQTSLGKALDRAATILNHRLFVWSCLIALCILVG